MPWYDTEQDLARRPAPRRMNVRERTDDKTIDLKETGGLFTNKGATSTVTYTLPLNARGRDGAFYRFKVEASYALRIDPSDSLGFIMHGAAQADGKYLESSYIGDEIVVASNSDGNWVVFTESPTVLSAGYAADSVDKRIFIAPRPYRVLGASLVPDTIGSDVGAVSAMVEKVPDGTDIGSGVEVLSAAFDLKDTVDTEQVGTLTATSADLSVAAGDAIAIDFTGTLTDAAGVVTVQIHPWKIQA